MSSPLVSVIVPSHNGERYIAEALRSILAQTYSPLEVIVVNDGSDDRTADIATSFGDPVRVLGQTRAGPVAARNSGLAAARGAFIAFLDDDDLWAREKTSLQMAAFVADPGLDVCVGHVQRFRDGASRTGMEVVGHAVPGFLTISMLAKRQAFDRVGPFDTSRQHSDSTEWFLRAGEIKMSVRLLSETLTFHRLHDTNRSRIHGDRSRHEFLRLVKLKIDRERRAVEATVPQRDE